MDNKLIKHFAWLLNLLAIFSLFIWFWEGSFRARRELLMPSLTDILMPLKYTIAWLYYPLLVIIVAFVIAIFYITYQIFRDTRKKPNEASKVNGKVRGKK